MITVNDLNLIIKKKKLLDNINVEFTTGQIHGIVGRNGSGKTLLMKCICGFIKPTTGRILIDDKLIGKDIDFPDSLGVIIETPNFINYLSGYKNLKMLAEYRGIIGKEKIQETMNKVGLKDVGKLSVGKYSLGMRQRLAIAQAIMENPDILILDEPFNGLDEVGVKEMRELFMELREAGKTIILASHNKEDIQILCDDIKKIDNGRIIS